MSKQISSVEFLVKEINQIIGFIPINKWDEIRVVVQQAKAMHKEEIINCMCIAFQDAVQMRNENYKTPYENWEQYYNETFEQ